MFSARVLAAQRTPSIRPIALRRQVLPAFTTRRVLMESAAPGETHRKWGEIGEEKSGHIRCNANEGLIFLDREFLKTVRKTFTELL